MKRVLQILGWALLAGNLVFLELTFGITIFYRKPVPNEPLNHPVDVKEISGDKLILADGRVIFMGYLDTGTEQTLRDSRFQVDVEPEQSDFVAVYVRQRTFICGTHAPRIVLPLVPRHYPAYQRRMLGLGSLKDPSG